jgi:hypothetical protein
VIQHILPKTKKNNTKTIQKQYKKQYKNKNKKKPEKMVLSALCRVFTALYAAWKAFEEALMDSSGEAVASAPVAAAPVVADDPVVVATLGTPSQAIKGVLLTRKEYYCSQCPIMEMRFETVQQIKTHNNDPNMKVFYLSPGYSIYVIRCEEWQCSDHPNIIVDYKVLKNDSPFPDFGQTWNGYDCTRKVYSYETLDKKCANHAPKPYVL